VELDRLRQTLTPQQEHIFDALLRANGRTLSHDFLVQAMYPPPRDQPPGADEVVKTQIYLLRAKLCSTPYSVRTERGAGYRLEFDGKPGTDAEAF
jgi:DNA-binding response OmpR family regulator